MPDDPYRYFRIEARDLGGQLGQGVLDLERGDDPAATVARMLRAAHTLKGAARVVRQPGIADDTHALEDALTTLRGGSDAVPAEHIARLLALVDGINAAVAALPAPGAEPPQPAAPAVRTPTGPPPARGTTPAGGPSAGQPPARGASAGPPPGRGASAGPPPGRGAPAGPPPAGRAPAGPAPAGTAPAGPAPAGTAQAGRESARPGPVRPTGGAVAEHAAVVRADSADIDDLLDAIGEAQAHLSPLWRTRADLDRIRRGMDLLVAQLDGPVGRGSPHDLTTTHDRIRSMATGLSDDLSAVNRGLTRSVEYGQRELGQIRTVAEQLRLVRAGSVFPALHRSVRDAGAVAGKPVSFEGTGGDTRLDPQVLSTVYGALLHVVRNAVAHGIEPQARRRAAGKPAEGRVAVEVRRQGTRVVFSCTDDGGGFDLGALRDAATTGLGADGAATLSPGDVMDLVLKGGISTSATVDELSGRGIGLDAVRDAADRLGGQVTVTTEPGLGATVELMVPLSLLSVDCLTVDVANTTAAIPLDAVLQCVRLRDAEVTGSTLRHGDNAVPLLALAPMFGREGAPMDCAGTAVIISAPAGIAAVGVGRVLGTAAEVVRAVPALAPASGIVGGLSLDGQGNPRIVLDPAGLVGEAQRVAASGGGRPADGPATGDRRRPLLVVDDSLTTRMLERSILESAGYEVELAASGEEALEKARDTTFGLFLVDIEMPGMDGYTFIERTRADPALCHIPAILVSSRASAQDRERGVHAGAAMHVAKGAFDQNELLEEIGKLVG